jgi:NADH-quinone oxidoreductase subunit M
MSLLTYIVLFPFLGALAVLATPRQRRVVIHATALAATLASLALALAVWWQFQPGQVGWQFEQRLPWAVSLGISYHVGVDGINLGLVLMGVVVAFAAACVSWEIRERDKEFYFLLLVMTGGILGAFVSIDLFFFYFFHELALVPTFIMIGVWGRGERKNYATFQITLYLSAGALIALIGLIALYLQSGAGSFDLDAISARLKTNPLSAGAQSGIFGLLLFGFGILVSLWPFHSWAPLGYAAAPTATAMLHAGVLKKFGLYGLLRVAVPLLPEGANMWLPVLACLCLGNILYCGLTAMRQRDLNLMIGNSSVAHVGFAFLGIASYNLIGATGAVMVMIAHGFLAALSFALSGYLYQQTGTLNMDELGGLLKRLPFIGAMLMAAMLAGCGVPGFANFVGEALVFFGAWTAYPVIGGLAIWGALMLGGVYMFRAIRSVLHGPLPEKWGAIADASNPWRKVPFVLLAASLLILGCYPRILTDKIKASAASLVAAAPMPARPMASQAAPVATPRATQNSRPTH